MRNLPDYAEIEVQDNGVPGNIVNANLEANELCDHYDDFDQFETETPDRNGKGDTSNEEGDQASKMKTASKLKFGTNKSTMKSLRNGTNTWTPYKTVMMNGPDWRRCTRKLWNIKSNFSAYQCYHDSKMPNHSNTFSAI